MINSLEEFKEKYPKFNIANYDIPKMHDVDYGVLYRQSKDGQEKFRPGIKYPKIQPYLSLEDENGIKLFIINDNKLYKLKKGSEPKTYNIDYQIDNINMNIFDQLFINPKKNAVKPTIIDEDIYEIK